MRARIVLALVVLLAAAVAAVAIGRREESRALDRELAELDAMFAVVGRDIAAPSLSGYRLGTLSCLFYDVSGIRYSVMLCFDDVGRLVESADRRGPTPAYASIVFSPEAASVTVDTLRLAAVLKRSGRSK